jgi:hypothetical protein
LSWGTHRSLEAVSCIAAPNTHPPNNCATAVANTSRRVVCGLFPAGAGLLGAGCLSWLHASRCNVVPTTCRADAYWHCLVLLHCTAALAEQNARALPGSAFITLLQPFWAPVGSAWPCFAATASGSIARHDIAPPRTRRSTARLPSSFSAQLATPASPAAVQRC